MIYENHRASDDFGGEPAPRLVAGYITVTMPCPSCGTTVRVAMNRYGLDDAGCDCPGVNEGADHEAVVIDALSAMVSRMKAFA
jgi:hypothetical protein